MPLKIEFGPLSFLDVLAFLLSQL
uniref:Uncharacterized protein n=1 Tax=Rhizophora mucronata TaxID=61149 RepID=A0A2P2PZ83_RHIMU